MEFGKCKKSNLSLVKKKIGEFKLIRHAFCLQKLYWSVKIKPENLNEKNTDFGKILNIL